MTGIEMLLKQMGIDPKKILGEIESLRLLFLDIKNRLERIETRLDQVLENRSVQDGRGNSHDSRSTSASSD